MRGKEKKLLDAAVSGDIKSVQILLDNGADVYEHGQNGATPLHTAARKGKTEIAALLLDRGAMVNRTDVNGLTPLYYVAWLTG